MNYPTTAPGAQAALACAGCATHNLGALASSVTASNGRFGYVCFKCAQRACEDGVFRGLVEGCIASTGTPVAEVERVFAGAGLTMLTTPAGVRALLTGFSRAASRETGTGFDVDAVMAWLARGMR